MSSNPPSQFPYFAFPFLERRLDSYFNQDDIKLSTLRLFIKLKCCANIYADTDYRMEPTPEHARARGWEEIQVAFTGQTELFLNYLVKSIWNSLDEDQYTGFKEAIVDGVRQAELNTSPDAGRLYLSTIRNSPILHPGVAWNFRIVTPNKGPRLEEWAFEKGYDPSKFSQDHYYLELQDRLKHNKVMPEEENMPPRLLPSMPDGKNNTGFTLIKGGKYTDPE